MARKKAVRTATTSPKSDSKGKTAGIGDEAVATKTGRTWPQWLTTLDASCARKMTHQQIVAVLHDEHGLSPWWSQMVTVGYEQARGMREKHEKPAGYEVSASKTINASITRVYTAFKDGRQRRKWLAPPSGGRFTIRTATVNKSMRVTWVDGTTHLNINFWDKGPSKCQAVLQHTKLHNAREAERQKKCWRGQLDALKALLEGG